MVYIVEQCPWRHKTQWGCFINVSRALQKDLSKIYNARNHIYGENFKLKLCPCAQSQAYFGELAKR